MSSEDAAYADSFDSIDVILDEARHGRMFIMVDSPHRENEGDLIVPAQCITPQIINFMAMHGRGLICMAITAQKAKSLSLQPMVNNNTSKHKTAFTVSIEAASGVSTGISAFDRAHTIRTAVDSKSTTQNLSSPGHVFPIVAKEGGVLQRAGHTEASCDIAHLAGFEPAGVMCEIMNDDGSMARVPELLKFSHQHGIKISTIEALINYRRDLDKK